MGGILEEEHLLLEILDLSDDDLSFGVGRNLWSINSLQRLECDERTLGQLQISIEWQLR